MQKTISPLYLIVFLFAGCSNYNNLYVSESSSQLASFNEMSDGKMAFIVLKTDKVIEALSVEVQPDSVFWLSSYNQTPMGIETDFVKEVRFQKIKRGIFQGAGIGLLIGAGAGLGVGYLSGQGTQFSSEDNAVLLGMIGAVAGSGLGIISGIEGASEDRYQIMFDQQNK